MLRAKPARKATIYDVAQATAASAATVSLVLNGRWARYRISEETADRVLEAARRLGYDANLRARGLRLSRSGLAGMILPHYRNRFFADLAEAFEAQARGRGLCPIVVSTQRDQAVETSVTQTLLAQNVEFLFIAGVPEPGALNRLCDAAGIAAVNIDLPGPGAPSVVSDNAGAARWLAQRLIGKVRARGADIAACLYIGGVAGEYATDGRVAGFLAALGEAGVVAAPERLALCGYPASSAHDAIAAYHARHAQLPAWLFVNSIAAFEGVSGFLASLDRTSLADCVVGCFDWDPFAQNLPFDVTMLRQDVETMMAHAFASLTPEAQAARALVMVEPARVGARSPA